MKIEIAASLLACDFSRLKDEILAVEAAGADLLHLDIMDGHFVPNITFGFSVIEKIKRISTLPLDAHLMISNPDVFLEDFKNSGCDWLSVHVEACPHLHRTVTRIQELGMKAGVAINPGTSLCSLDAILKYVDYVLLMSVNPGFSGQSFIEESIFRVKALKKLIGNHKARIQIDGGINDTNIQSVVHAGAQVVVLGTAIFSSKDYSSQIAKLRANGER